MVDFLKNWIINIVTIVMVVVLLEIILPSGKMKKYVSLVTGFIIMIAIINPFVGIFGKGFNIEDIQLVNADKIDKSVYKIMPATWRRNK
jgi:stage III sporulation protein AF